MTCKMPQIVHPKNAFIYIGLSVLFASCFSTKVVTPQNQHQADLKNKNIDFLEEGSKLISYGYNYQ